MPVGQVGGGRGDTSPPVAVRPRLDGDLPACVAGLAETHLCDRYPYRWPEDPTAWLRHDGALAAWVGLAGGRVAGHAALRSGDDSRDPSAWTDATGRRPEGIGIVARLLVTPRARHAGLGLLLLATAVAEATDRGLWPVLDVMAHNTAAIALYESLGWSQVGARPLVLGDGERVELLYYVAPAPGRPAGAPARSGDA